MEAQPNNHFPASELKAWLDSRYSDNNDAYSQTLKRAHLWAIDSRDANGLNKLANILFITKSYLYADSPEEYRRLTDIYDRLNRWIKNRPGV